MNNKANKLIALAAANPVGAKLLAQITEANRAPDLHRLADNEVPATAGLNEEERLGLLEAIHLQFCMLNAAALRGADKPRWSL
ncbi:MAG TPA: hypothetical protein VF988_06595 [Verrucomicrobiae bacterium]